MTRPPTDPRLFHLLIDESGQFSETSTDPAEKADAARKRQFPSQLAGIVVPDQDVLGEPITTLVDAAQRDLGMPVQKVFHATELNDERYPELLEEVVSRVVKAGWQPVRLVNTEGVSYGDRRANYVNMVMELAVRILEKLSRTEEGPIELKVWPAVVITMDKEDEKTPGERFIQPAEYIPRMQEAMALLAVRMGWGQRAGKWTLSFGGNPSAKKDRRFFICDFFSHASHDDYCRCTTDSARAALKAAFGDCDYSLSIPEVPNRVLDLQRRGSLGLALREIVEHTLQTGGESEHQPTLERLRRALVDDLVRTGEPARDTHLQLLCAWTNQLVDYVRDLGHGAAAARWMIDQVAEPIAARLGDKARTLAWFRYAQHRALLSAANHQGHLHDARVAIDAMSSLTRDLAARWEHNDLLLRGLVVEAVHRTDSYEHAEAAGKARLVATFYEEMRELCNASLGDVFPKDVRSQVLGEALGTELQALIYEGGLDDDARLAAARAVSDRAIEQFDRPADRARQLQYRCQLETAAGQFPEARSALAEATGAGDDSHQALWARTQAKDAGPDRVWSTLHYLRLAARAAGHRSSERTDACTVIRTAKLDRLDLVTDPAMIDYPAHGIRRYAAIACAAAGDTAAALSILGHLRALYSMEQPAERPLLTTLWIAAQLEVAAYAWEGSGSKARELIESTRKERPGALKLVQQLLKKTDSLPGFTRTFGPWPEQLQALLKGPTTTGDARDLLLKMGSQVGY